MTTQSNRARPRARIWAPRVDAALPSGHHTEKVATFDTKIGSAATCPAQPPKVREGGGAGYSPPREPRASSSMTSTARCSMASSTGLEHGASSLRSRS